MGGELEGTLSELAKGFGTSTGQLWSWFQGEGLSAYAHVMVARLAVWCCIASVVCLVGMALLIVGVRRALSCQQRWLDDVSHALLLWGGVATGLGLLALVFIAPELAGWMASPEGMAITSLVRIISQ